MRPPPRTVAFITPGGRGAPGGIARMVDYCVKAWPPASEFQLKIIDSYGPGRKVLMPFFALRAFAAAFRLLLTGRAQLLHINFSERLSIWRKGMFVLLGNAFGIPVILHLHGAEFADYFRKLDPLRRAAATTILRRAQRVIVLGRYWRDFLVREMQIDPQSVRILSNAVPDTAPDTAQAKARREPNRCRILFLGVLGERKGVPTLLEALGARELAALSWHMTIAGNGPVDIYKNEAREAGLSERIAFPGLLSETEARAALAQTDIFVLPSRQEGLPMAILEALSYGIPVVATPVGSVAEAVIDGETGLLVPVGDSRALAAALARLVSDEPYRERLGQQARRLFEKRFVITAYNAALEAIYREAIAR